MSTKQDTQTSATSTAGNGKESAGLTAEEKAAMKERNKELKAEAAANKNKAEGKATC